jgi:hypothetical protein
MCLNALVYSSLLALLQYVTSATTDVSHSAHIQLTVTQGRCCVTKHHIRQFASKQSTSTQLNTYLLSPHYTQVVAAALTGGYSFCCSHG